MPQINPIRRRETFVSILVLLAFLATGILLSVKPPSRELGGASRAARRQPAGGPQLIAVEPLPAPDGAIDGAMEGMECQWMPATAYATLAATLQESRASGTAAAAQSIDLDRAPVRVLRDTYPTYSAVAVDLNSNEVYLQDENLFGYKVFNRLDNTPPGAEFTEPKRMVGGINTKLEFNCALYVDPRSGDVYSVNNDTMDTMVVFPREARGDLAPKRELRTPHGTFGIAVDEEPQELFLTVQHRNAVVVYRKTAEGEDQPIRTLAGDRTELEDPHGVALDTKNGWLFVTNHGHVKDSQPPRAGRFEPPSITVYPLKASGDTAPLRILEGPKTQLNWPAHLFVDPEHGDLYVANDVGDSVLVFRTTDTGDVAPARIIHGPKTGLKNPTGLFVDAKNDELWVSNMGNHSAVVFPRTANGDAVPLRTIRSAPTGKVAMAIGNPGAVAYDSKREEVLVPN